MTWTDDAACIGHPEHWWFPHADAGPAAYTLARTVCTDCPVRQQCLDEALNFPNPDQHGMFGGLTPKERSLIRRRQDTR